AAPPKLERELVEQAVEKLADPTAADADTQARILASVADPKQQRLTVEERCELIGISRSTWYRHLSDDPSFAVRYHAACRMALADQVGPVLEALASSALMPGKDGHADRKLFLE